MLRSSLFLFTLLLPVFSHAVENSTFVCSGDVVPNKLGIRALNLDLDWNRNQGRLTVFLWANPERAHDQDMIVRTERGIVYLTPGEGSSDRFTLLLTKNRDHGWTAFVQDPSLRLDCTLQCFEN
jgi:hypothetical protein